MIIKLFASIFTWYCIYVCIGFVVALGYGIVTRKNLYGPALIAVYSMWPIAILYFIGYAIYSLIKKIRKGSAT